jgi:hypothetical protein
MESRSPSREGMNNSFFIKERERERGHEHVERPYHKERPLRPD